MTNLNPRGALACALVSLLLLAGCAVAATTPAPSASPTPSPLPTVTPTPTATPTPAPAPPAPTPTASSPLMRSVPLGVAFTIQGGETVELATKHYLLTFVGVKNDSRCPSDVVCVWAGEATIQLDWRPSATADGDVGQIDLTIGADGMGKAQFGRFSVTASNLLPYPKTSNPRPTRWDYAVTLKVDSTP